MGLPRLTSLQYDLGPLGGAFGRRSLFSLGVSRMEIYEASVSLIVRALVVKGLAQCLTTGRPEPAERAVSKNPSALLGRDAGPFGEGGRTTEGRYPASSPGGRAMIRDSDRTRECAGGDAGPGVLVGEAPSLRATRPSGSTSSAARPGTAHIPP